MLTYGFHNSTLIKESLILNRPSLGAIADKDQLAVVATIARGPGFYIKAAHVYFHQILRLYIQISKDAQMTSLDTKRKAMSKLSKTINGFLFLSMNYRKNKIRRIKSITTQFPTPAILISSCYSSTAPSCSPIAEPYLLSWPSRISCTSKIP